MAGRATQRTEIGELFVESVGDDGEMIMRLPGGDRFMLHVPTQMVRYYRRLVPSGGPATPRRAG